MKKLNIGSGQHPWPRPWVNVDIVSEPGFADDVDVVADVLDLPFDDEVASHVYLGHLLEHLERDDVPTALAEVKRVMASDAELMVVGPDFERAKTLAPALVSAIWPGAATDGPGGHKWPATEGETLAMLVDAGFDAQPIQVAAVPVEWPCVNRDAWQFAIEATARTKHPKPF